MKIIGISGLPGSGKSLVSKKASEKGAIIVGMGDVVREESKKRKESSKQTAQNLREEYGKYIIAELTIKKIKQIIKDSESDLLIIEGIRSEFEVELFKENFKDFILVSIFANPKTRYNRLKLRKRSDDSQDWDNFKKRDQMELGFGIGNVISTSDILILNTGSLEEYERKIDEFLKKTIKN